MASYGYAGKIAIIDLTSQSTDIIDTSKYEEWIGGHGLCSALFWDYCKDKTVDAFDPGNVMIIAATPFSGTGVPTASARVEICGISPLAEPQWYVRTSMGGRMGGAMKAAGFDAVAITGAADAPVWLNIVNGKITFEDASNLWGLGTHDTQEEIWDYVTNQTPLGDWYALSDKRDGGRTTQKPAVVCIGQAGENLNCMATLQHEANHASGQGGFGAVFGSKNLKAVSFIGTGAISVANPAEMFDLRIAMQEEYGWDVDDPAFENWALMIQMRFPGWGFLQTGGVASIPNRPEGCQGCMRSCRRTFADGYGNEGFCFLSNFYPASLNFEKDPDTTVLRKTISLVSDLGLNGFEFYTHLWLNNLYKMGIVGPGCKIDSGDWDWEDYGSYKWMEKYLTDVAYGRGVIGKALLGGPMRAAKELGRWEEDSATGLLGRYAWGYSKHYDARVEADWGYGSIFGDRDINIHCFNFPLHYLANDIVLSGVPSVLSCDKIAQAVAAGTGLNDPMCFDYSEEGRYSDARVRTIQWLFRYSRTWLNSLGFCEFNWPAFVNYNSKTGDYSGDPRPYEAGFYNAVTGKDATYEDIMYGFGTRVWNLDRAIWILQGRHRDQEVLCEWDYSVPAGAYWILTFENGTWDWRNGAGSVVDRTKFEDFKTRFYKAEGWDPTTGWPTRATLEANDLKYVADALEAAGKLGEAE